MIDTIYQENAVSYVFSSVRPPLLRDYPAILSVPTVLLKGQTYTATDQPNSPTVYNDSQHDHWQTYNSFIITRYQVWRLNTPPYHAASNGSHSHSVTSGYDQSKMTKFVQTISVTAGAAGFGMSASVTASLELTSEETQTWSTSTTNVTTLDLKAGNTYDSWTLFDHLEVESQQWYQYEYKGASPPGFTRNGDPQVTVVEIAILNYDDSVADPDAHCVPTIQAVLAHTRGVLHPA
ncbi:hypothetical protein [Massilia rubra]|uniref:Insecticidal crystal toxin domain-containing protein n=1 Tax=Massilia rubra TaxID=2607910 RepID=A0ABX0LE44_9BURK|nr:hypothetical protein [Massilia rubra]NHZ32903.1 hypothetical protein [Massilia rubra]